MHDVVTAINTVWKFRVQAFPLSMIKKKKKSNSAPKQPVDLISAMDCSMFVHRKYKNSNINSQVICCLT